MHSAPTFFVYLLLALAPWAVSRGADIPALPAASQPASAIAPAPATAAEGTMPLSEIKPGMKGEWRTVVSGSEVQSFGLEVLGVMENFIGPRRAVIICQALDPGQVLNGPVAGMSGSPVYIDGKLIGAYAYGFTFPKDQAIIGVTPIADMLEVLDAPGLARQPGRPGPPRMRPVTPTTTENTIPAADPARPASGGTATDEWRVTRGTERLRELDVPALLRPLPTPLMASGVSARTLAVFKDEFARRGVSVVQAPGGTASEGGPPASSLAPGSAIGVVLMNGDFSLSGVGTLTWRQGDKLLGFGHPMFNFGPVDMPLATAEVVTVVRALDQSFKLTNVGHVVGTISQDRLTGIAGAIGATPPMAQFRAHVTAPDGTERTFQGRMWDNREYSPMIGAIGLLESLSTTMQSELEQTFFVDANIEFEGFPPIRLKQVATGAGGADGLALGMLDQLDALMNNPFETPKIKALDFDVRLRNTRLLSEIEGVRVESGELHAGDTLRVTVKLSNYLDEPTEHSLEIPIPATAAGETLTLFIGDAAAVDAFEQGASRRDLRSLADYVAYLRQQRSQGAAYVRLLRNAPGLRLEGATLMSLPPTVEALYLSPKNVAAADILQRTSLWEAAIPVPGVFRGRHSQSVRVLP